MKTLTELYEQLIAETNNADKKLAFLKDVYIKQFVTFCNEHYNGEVNQDIINDFFATRPADWKEGTKVAAFYALKHFVVYLKNNGYPDLDELCSQSKIAKLPRPKSKWKVELPLVDTMISKNLQEYIDTMKPIGKLNLVEHQTLIRFNDHCHENFPNAVGLNEYIINSWCDKREGENMRSRNQRIKPVCDFLEYGNNMNWFCVGIPDTPTVNTKYLRIPHTFSNDELSAFFKSIDNTNMKHNELKLDYDFRRSQYSVFFRLLFSTGMRTVEARVLNREDVDLENGIINIKKTKGYNQHRIALHPSMLKILRKFDKLMDSYIPNRKAFFPDYYGGFHGSGWYRNAFSRHWRKLYDSDARAYDLRSNYAVKNINSWKYDGAEWIDKVIYLCRSMGHTHLSSTMYYYRLVPEFRNILSDKSSRNMEKLHPDMNDFINDGWIDIYEEKQD